MSSTDTFNKLKQLSELENELFNEDNFDKNYIKYIQYINNKNSELIKTINYLEKNDLVLKQTIKKINSEREELQKELDCVNRKIDKKVKKCSKCGETGHNSRTCTK